MKDLFSFLKPKKDIQFVDTKRLSYHNFSVERAVDVPTNTRKVQQDKYGKHLMPYCPGILDYAQFGYIIPAWVDIHIMANKAGTSWYLGDKGARGDRGFDNGVKMDEKFIEGAFMPDGIDPAAILFPSPWKIFTQKNISALLMPAFYHSTFLDDLYVTPGLVDYKDFHITNFICMPKRECNVHIKAGDPLLHVIPFLNKDITASVGPATDEMIDKTANLIPGDDKQYYRKFMGIKKKFNMQKEENKQ
jgi:hypothetical protein